MLFPLDLMVWHDLYAMHMLFERVSHSAYTCCCAGFFYCLSCFYRWHLTFCSAIIRYGFMSETGEAKRKENFFFWFALDG